MTGATADVTGPTADVTAATADVAGEATGSAPESGLADLRAATGATEATGATADVTGRTAGPAADTGAAGCEAATGAVGSEGATRAAGFEAVTGAAEVGVVAGVRDVGAAVPDGAAGPEGGSAGFGVAAEVTVATADVTEWTTEPVAALVTGAASFGAVTGVADAGAADGGGEVAACACRENTSRMASIPADTIAHCIARRAMRSNVAWDTSNSRSAGRDSYDCAGGASQTLLTQNLHARVNSAIRRYQGVMTAWAGMGPAKP